MYTCVQYNVYQLEFNLKKQKKKKDYSEKQSPSIVYGEHLEEI